MEAKKSKVATKLSQNEGLARPGEKADPDRPALLQPSDHCGGGKDA